MKIIFLFRDSFDAKYILSQLTADGIEGINILESGKSAKIRKLKKMFRQSTLLFFPKIVLDIISLVLYSNFMEKKMENKIGKIHKNYKINKIFDDANDLGCIEYIKSQKPELIFIYGTAILRKIFLENVKNPIINIHSGILPEYRNVHSDFWAYSNKDYQRIGISLIYLDAGVDTGKIVLQKSVQYEAGDKLADLKTKNLRLIPVLIKVLIKRFRSGKPKGITQDIHRAHVYPTPTLFQIAKLALKGF